MAALSRRQAFWRACKAYIASSRADSSSMWSPVARKSSPARAMSACWASAMRCGSLLQSASTRAALYRSVQVLPREGGSTGVLPSNLTATTKLTAISCWARALATMETRLAPMGPLQLDNNGEYCFSKTVPRGMSTQTGAAVSVLVGWKHVFSLLQCQRNGAQLWFGADLFQ